MVPANLLFATSEAQPAVGWPVIDCDAPGVARLHECRARMARRRRLIRRPPNFEGGSAAVASVGPALRGQQGARGSGAGRDLGLAGESPFPRIAGRSSRPWRCPSPNGGGALAVLLDPDVDRWTRRFG
jgi:hypothetical protein